MALLAFWLFRLFGNRPRTASESTVSHTELSEFWALAEFRKRDSVSSIQPVICVPKRTHREFYSENSPSLPRNSPSLPQNSPSLPQFHANLSSIVGPTFGSELSRFVPCRVTGIIPGVPELGTRYFSVMTVLIHSRNSLGLFCDWGLSEHK